MYKHIKVETAIVFSISSNTDGLIYFQSKVFHNLLLLDYDWNSYVTLCIYHFILSKSYKNRLVYFNCCGTKVVHVINHKIYKPRPCRHIQNSIYLHRFPTPRMINISSEFVNIIFLWRKNGTTKIISGFN